MGDPWWSPGHEGDCGWLQNDLGNSTMHPCGHTFGIDDPLCVWADYNSWRRMADGMEDTVRDATNHMLDVIDIKESGEATQALFKQMTKWPGQLSQLPKCFGIIGNCKVKMLNWTNGEVAQITGLIKDADCYLQQYRQIMKAHGVAAVDIVDVPSHIREAGDKTRRRTKLARVGRILLVTGVGITVLAGLAAVAYALYNSKGGKRRLR